MSKKYISTKTYTQIAPVAYRQWRAGTHCESLHGYALSFHFKFETDNLDERNWCIDYGSMRSLKYFIEEHFDHCLLVAIDDPHREALLNLGKLGIAKITEVEKTGCEGIADFLYEYINTVWLRQEGHSQRDIWCCEVQVRETDANMAMRCGHKEDGEFTDYIG